MFDSKNKVLKTNNLSESELINIAFWHTPSAQMVSSQRIIVIYNWVFAKLFGYDTDELKGQSILRLYPTSADFEKRGEIWKKALIKNTVYEDERFMQGCDNEIFWVRARGLTLTPDDPFELMIWTFNRVDYASDKKGVLTRREQEIASYIANGWTSKAIAEELQISQRTVEHHRASLMRKLGAKNQTDLIAKYILRN